MRIRLRPLAALLVAATLSFANLTFAADPCPPCQAFDELDKQIRDGALPRAEAQRQFADLVTALDVHLKRNGAPLWPEARWVFPLKDYDLATSGADAAKGYLATGYDYFDGNRHGGHPSYDLFIVDRNRDNRDDRTGRPVTVVAMTGGIVVAAEPHWSPDSPLRGGKYLWIYDPSGQLLSYYAHNDTLLVGVGDRVTPGTPLATVGRSGANAARPRSPSHLHLTVLKVLDGYPRPENIYRRLQDLSRRP